MLYSIILSSLVRPSFTMKRELRQLLSLIKNVGQGFSLASQPECMYQYRDSNPKGLPYRIEIPIR
ncbi:MAG: hypothetical protein L3J17_08335 [Candidatus Jettenia sp.]|nr:MAG: hypothetical protein L3J17_08335 [Candidatus Jettenia sp.]